MRNRSLNMEASGVTPAADMTGQEAAQGSLQPLFVEGIRALDDLEERVGERQGFHDRPPAADVEAPRIRLSRRPTEPKSNRAQMPVAEEENVARMGVGVEYPVHHDLAQETVEQFAGQYIAIPCEPTGTYRREGRPSRRSITRTRLVDIDRPGPGCAQQSLPGGQRLRHRCHVACLDTQVELFAQGIAKPVGQIDCTHRPTPAPIETRARLSRIARSDSTTAGASGRQTLTTIRWP